MYMQQLIQRDPGENGYAPGQQVYSAWGGYNLTANPGMKLIAVDPSVIPLGSRVYVEGYGEAIAKRYWWRD